MNFKSTKPLLLPLALLLPLLAISFAETNAQDTVFKNKVGGGTSRVPGKITAMTPEGVTIGKQEVAAEEIRRISVGKEPSAIARLRDQMNSGRYADCLEGLAKLSDLPSEPLLQQEVAFMRAFSSARLSLTQGSVGAKDAGVIVAKFLADYPTSFHTYPALEQYGLLIYSFGKPDLAAKEFEKLKNAKWKEMRWRGHFLHGRMMQITNQTDQAKANYEAILADKSTDVATARFQLLAQCELAKLEGLSGQAGPAIEQLRGMIKSQTSANPQLFAYIYNAKGAIFEQLGQLKAARTAYLHTTLLFGGETEAAAEATYRLAKLWPQLNQAGRANDAREQLNSKFRQTYWKGIVDKN
jgi:hypothetical protein